MGAAPAAAWQSFHPPFAPRAPRLAPAGGGAVATAFSLVFAVLATLSVAPVVRAQQQAAGAPPPAPVAPAGAASTLAVDADALLARIQDAARKLDYSGIFAYQQGEMMQSSRVVHVVDGTGERERLEVLDGSPREYLRHNDQIQCLMPEHKTVLIQQQRGDRFPGLLLGHPSGLSRFYLVHVDAALHRVAGRQCRMISLEPLDKKRYGYRLCADAENDLLLKAQTLSPGNAVVEQVAFTALRVGHDVDPKQVDSHWTTSDWKVVHGDMQPIDLAALGWRIPAPAGFVPVSQVSRTMAHGDAVNQLVMSDGLAAISVFIEPYDKKRNSHQPHGAYRRGAINVYGMRIADFWVTALGEVPVATLEQLAQSTQYVPPAPTK
jgi:sigma-E factor negative regulatory protein RseB